MRRPPWAYGMEAELARSGGGPMGSWQRCGGCRRIWGSQPQICSPPRMMLDLNKVSEPLCFRSSQCPPPPETRSQHCRPRRRQPACRVHVSPSLIPHRLPPPLGPTGGRPLLNSSPPPLDSSPPPAAAAARVHGRQTAETGWGWGCFSPIAVCGVAVSRPSGTEHRAEGSRI
ncbi:hypothetical protein ZWY2020_005626 [Hordeum vulgare]|nr:hypothetical protein ZWY2020_005626 [Hordeum vulgare]